MLKTGEHIVIVEDCEDSEEEKQQQQQQMIKQQMINAHVKQQQSGPSQRQRQGATSEMQKGAKPPKGQTVSMEQVASAASILAQLPHAQWQYQQHLQDALGAQPWPKVKPKPRPKWHERRERQVSRVS